jgi:hypothetical protein
MTGKLWFRTPTMGAGVCAAGVFGALAILGMACSSAHAAASDNIRLSDDIAPPPFGFDTAPPHYVIVKETPLYVSPYIYPGTVSKDRLKPGQAVTVLAKVKDYGWVLVGRNSIGVGYIPISRLAPAKKTSP